MAKRIYYDTLVKNTQDNSRVKLSDLRSGDNKREQRVQAALDATADYRANMNAWAEKERERDRIARQKAIELARAGSTSNVAANTNAGNDRTTALRQPQQNIQGNAILPTYSGQNIAANGANVNTDFKTETTTKNGWKGLIGNKSQEQTISKEQSLAHANEVYAPYKDNQEVTDLLKQYVSTNDDLENLRMHGASADQKYHYVREKQKLEKEIRNITGLSKDDFNQIAENYTYLRHDEERKEQQEKLDNASGLEKAALTGLNVATSAIGNYQSAIGLLKKPNDPELGRDYNSVTSYWSNLSRDTKEAVHTDIDESTMADYQKALAGFGYDAFTMGAESAASQLLGGAGLASFFAGGYASSLEEAEQRGLTKGQAQGYALVSGGLEYATEKIPFDNLKNIFKGKAVSKEAVKGSLMPYVKALFKQAKEEATEEVINGVGDILADALINSDKSKINIAIQNYMQEEGLSEEEATRKAFFEEGKDILYAAASAAVSAGASAGPALTIQAYETTKAGKNLADYENKTGNLTRNVENENYIPETRENYVADEDYRQAQETRQAILAASEKAAKGERISGKEARALAEAYGQTAENLRTARNVSEQKQLERENSVPEKNEYEPETKSYEQVKEDIEFASTPYQLAKAIESVTEETDELKELIDYKKSELEMYNFKAEEVENAVTAKKAYEMGQKGEEVTKEQLEKIPVQDRQKVLEANNSAYNKQILKEHPDAVVDKTTGKYFAPSEVKVEGADIVVVDTEGNVHTEYENPRINQVMNIVTQTSKDTRGHATDQSIYDTNVQQAAYAIELAINSPEATSALVRTAVESIFNNASIGHKSWAEYEKSSKGLFTKVDAKVAEKLYNSIREQARKSDSAKTKNVEGKKTSDKVVSDTLRENLDAETVALLEALGNKIGYNFVASTNPNARGSIVPGSRQIAIGSNSLDELWSIKSHEAIAEYLQAHGNEEDVIALQDDMLKYLENKLGTVEFNDLINQYQSVYRSNAKKGTVDEGKSRRAAANEMFNDTVFALISSEEGVKDYISWIKENNTAAEQVSLLQKVKDFFSKIFDYVSNYIQTGNFNAAERAALEMDAKTAKEFRDRLFKLMDDAIENAKATEGKSSPSNERNSYVILKTGKTAYFLSEVLDYDTEYKSLKGKIDNNESHFWAKNGDYIYKVGSKLVYTDHEKDEFGISKIIAVDTTIVQDETTIDYILNELIEGEKDGQSVQVAHQIISNNVGSGVFTEYTTADFGENERYDRPTKRGKISSDVYHAERKQNRTRVYIENEQVLDTPKDIDNTVRNSFAGISSKTSDLEQLKIAQELYKKGMGDLTILETTGWFLGMDNQWKYEIPDNDIEIFKEGNREYIKNNPDFARYLELENKILFTDSDYTEEEYDELMRLDEVVTSDEYYKTKRYGKLSDFIQHDELFRSYPWMEKVDVMFVPMESDKEKGYADPEDLVIALNLKFQTDVGWNKDALKSTLLHEIQHIIQAQEGFAGGSTPEWWANIRDERIERDQLNIKGAKEHLQKFVDKAKKEGKPASTGEFVEQSVKRVADKDDSYNMEDHWAAVADWKANSSIYHYEHMISKLERHIDRLLSESDIELYYNTAGEIEARDTANRANLTREQRLEEFPKQNAKDVVYPKSNIMDRRYSIKVDSNGRSLSEGQQEYFKDSKVVDEDGRLRVVYHGTMANFTIFDLKEARDTEDIEAFFFSGDIEEAEGYGNLGEYYLNITNPADYDTAYDIFFKYKGQEGAGRLAREELQSLGYDGVIAVDEDSPEYTEYLAFNSNQIKRVDNLNPTENDDIRKSIKVDEQYMAAVKANDTEKMQQLVEEAARSAGYDSPILYHGTNKFGFTSFDLEKMDDKRTIFLTNNSNIASTYSGSSQKKAVSEGFTEDISKIPTNKLADALNNAKPDDGMDNYYEYFDSKGIDALKENTLKEVTALYDELDKLLDTITDEKALTALKKIKEIQMLFSIEDVMEKENVKKDLSTAIYMAVHHSNALSDYKESWDKLQQKIRKAYALTHDRVVKDTEFIIENYLDGYLFEVLTDKEARMTLKENTRKGIYSFYAKLGNELVLDANGANWNELGGLQVLNNEVAKFNLENTHIEKLENNKVVLKSDMGGIINYKTYPADYEKHITDEEIQQFLLNGVRDNLGAQNTRLGTTREIAKLAKQIGYDSVVIKNIRDNGGRNHKIDYDELADIYELFNPNDIKSADPITYDNAGNVIPLSERFNLKEQDFRYSIKVDSDGKELSESQQEFFKDSKVVDSDGNLLVLYHGSVSSDKFTEFSLDAKGLVNGRVLGDGFYFTPNKEAAKHWSRGSNNVYKVYLNIKNPYYASAEDKVPKNVKDVLVKHYEELYDKFAAEDPKWKLKNPIKKIWVESTFKRNAPEAESALAALNWGDDVVNKSDLLKSLGYDGIIHKNSPKNYALIGGEQYVAFEPNQIKKTTNKKPSEASNDIRYSIKVDEDRIYNYRGTEIVQNPTNTEYQQMRKDILDERPWMNGPDTILLRHTYDEEGNTYYWDAYAGMHRDIEPAIAKHWNTRVNQQWEWWKDSDKDFWANRSFADNARNSIKIYGEASPYADSLNETKVIQTMIGTMNNALSKADAFAISNDELIRIENYIKNKYKTDLEPGEIAANIAYAFAHMQQNKLDSDYENMMNYLLNIGDEIIKKSNMIDPASKEIYDQARAAVSSKKFKLSDAERAEISNAFGGSWKSAFGAMQKAGIKLDNKNGTNIDTVFSEIREDILKAAGVDMSDADKPGQQILAIIDTMTALEPTAYLWDGANDMDKALTVVSDIVDQYYSVATEQLEKNIAKGTKKGNEKIKKAIDNEKTKLRGQWAKYKDEKAEEFNSIVAEKNLIIQQQQNQIKQQQEQMKQWNKDAKEKDRAVILDKRQMEATAKLQAKQAVQNYKEREERARQIENIKKTGIRLIKWLDNPTEKQHIPIFLQKPLGEFLAAIDFLPTNAKADSKSTLSWHQRMQDLRDVLVKIKDAEGDGDNSPEAYFAQNMLAKDLLNMMDEFLGKESWDEFTQSYITTKRAAKKVSLLDAKELATLNNIMSALSASINNMNKTLANSFYSDMDALAADSFEELRELKKNKNKVNLLAHYLKNFAISEKTPVYFFEELGKGAKSVFDELRAGWNLRTEHIREASEHMQKFKKENGIDDKDISTWSSHMNKFELSEGNIELSDAQIMSLYRTVNRAQGRPHVMLGGIRPSDTKLKTKYLHYSKALHINYGDYLKIISVLSDKQILMADEITRYMSKECSKWGNRTFEKMFGYRKFTEDDYFPLKTDAHSRGVTNASDNNVAYNTLKNGSATKNIVPNANNAVMLDDIFDVFASHVDFMASYDGFVMPIADAMRWFNYSQKIMTGTEEGTRVDVVANMQEALDSVLGEAGNKYFRTFIKNINGIYEGKGGNIELLDLIASNYKAQAVMANLRVVAQQPMAIARASDRIEDRYILKAVALPAVTLGIAANKWAKKAQQNSSLAYWKAQGYYETMIGQSLKSIITGDQSFKDKVNELGGFLAGKADDITWGVIYRAAELKVSKIRPDLKYDSKEYTKEVVKVFEDIIDHTQVIDTIFHKSQIMRSANPVAKMATSFMAEPTLTANIAAHRVWEAQRALGNGDKKEAAKIIGKLLRVLITNSLMVSLAQSIFDSLRDDDVDKDFLEKMLYYEFGVSDDMTVKDVALSNFVDNLNPLNWIPVAKEIMSYMQGFDASNMYVDGIYSALDTISELSKIVRKESTKTKYGQIYTAAKGISQLTGMPISNAVREVRTLHNNINDLWGGKDLLTTQAAEKKLEKKIETNRLNEVFDENDLKKAEAEVTAVYEKAIENGKAEKDAWSDARSMLKEQFQRQVAEHPEEKANYINRYATLLSKTKHSKKGTFINYTDKEAKAYMKTYNWYEE